MSNESKPAIIAGPPGVGKTTLIETFWNIGKQTQINIDDLFVQTSLFPLYQMNQLAIQQHVTEKQKNPLLTPPTDLQSLVSDIEMQSLQLKGEKTKTTTFQEAVDGGLITAFGYAWYYHQMGFLQSNWEKYKGVFVNFAKDAYQGSKIVRLTDESQNIKQRIISRMEHPGEEWREYERDYSYHFLQGVSNGIGEAIQELVKADIIKESDVVNINVSEYGDYRQDVQKHNNIVEKLRRNGITLPAPTSSTTIT